MRPISPRRRWPRARLLATVIVAFIAGAIAHNAYGNHGAQVVAAGKQLSGRLCARVAAFANVELSCAPATKRPRPAARQTVASQLRRYAPKVRPRWHRAFRRADLTYPPSDLRFVVIKSQRRLEVHARESREEPWVRVVDYDILGASGVLGPKRREGDKQVPEGVYRVNFLNPNSSNHLSMRINYPNSDDRALARVEGRKRNLGGEIYIHGKRTSIGCLAMGDPAIEELFVLAADVGIDKIDVVISPVDLRRHRLPKRLIRREPKVLARRYDKIGATLKETHR